MLHWQHKNEQARFYFGIKLGSFVLFFHLCILGYLFFLLGDTHLYHVVFYASRAKVHVPVIYAPFHQQLQTASKNSDNAKMTNASRQHKKSSQKEHQKSRKPLIAKTRKNVAKQPIKKIAKSKAVTKKTALVSPLQKKENNKFPSKKEVVEKPVRTALQKTDKKEQPEKQKQIQEKEQLLLKAPEKESSALPAVAEQHRQEGGVSENSVFPVEQPEWYALQLQEALQSELVQHWSVPVGLPSNLMCQITIEVNQQGLVEKSKILRSSGVLVFDVSARTAASNMKLPQIARGKTFVITCKQ